MEDFIPLLSFQEFNVREKDKYQRAMLMSLYLPSGDTVHFLASLMNCPEKRIVHKCYRDIQGLKFKRFSITKD